MLKKLFARIIFSLFLRKGIGRPPSIKAFRIKQSDKEKEKMVEVRPEIPKEGGLLTHFPNQKFPFPGFPDKGIVLKIGFAKRLIPLGIDWMHKQIIPFIPKNPNLYSRPVREIYRLFNILIERDEGPGMKEKFAKMRDVICVYAEYDDAYRFRGQDIVGEVRLEELVLQDGDKWWFLPKHYNFKGKEEFKKKHEDRKDDD